MDRKRTSRRGSGLRHSPSALHSGFSVAVASRAAVLHAISVARSFSSINFVLNETRAVPDTIFGGCHVFLVPSVGAAEIQALHRALYDGPFGPHYRPEIPFIPHMTVAAHPTERDSQGLVARLDGNALSITGRILEIDAVEVLHGKTPSARTIPLSQPET